jgi:hypothetical protein
VLHTLEKKPQDRPANAAEFSKELLATAERLGFEHAALTSSPNLAALRSVGTESPSGRLVIDISRLRENRATADISEETIMRPAAAVPAVGDGSAQSLAPAKYSFPRISLPLATSIWSNRQFRVMAVVVAAVLLLGIILAVRSRTGFAPAASVVTASPSPTIEPTPSPSPSPSPKAQAKKPPVQPKKKETLLNKMKRIFKKPF